uniref:Arf-GAP domain-containing protein n=1 Tax=Macrostomum lignano TaxID=282301 RepID=A0A1I8H0E5_9PLAT
AERLSSSNSYWGGGVLEQRLQAGADVLSADRLRAERRLGAVEQQAAGEQSGGGTELRPGGAEVGQAGRGVGGHPLRLRLPAHGVGGLAGVPAAGPQVPLQGLGEAGRPQQRQQDGQGAPGFGGGVWVRVGAVQQQRHQAALGLLLANCSGEQKAASRAKAARRRSAASRSKQARADVDEDGAEVGLGQAAQQAGQGGHGSGADSVVPIVNAVKAGGQQRCCVGAGAARRRGRHGAEGGAPDPGGLVGEAGEQRGQQVVAAGRIGGEQLLGQQAGGEAVALVRGLHVAERGGAEFGGSLRSAAQRSGQQSRHGRLPVGAAAQLRPGDVLQHLVAAGAGQEAAQGELDGLRVGAAVYGAVHAGGQAQRQQQAVELAQHRVRRALRLRQDADGRHRRLRQLRGRLSAVRLLLVGQRAGDLCLPKETCASPRRPVSATPNTNAEVLTEAFMGIHAGQLVPQLLVRVRPRQVLVQQAVEHRQQMVLAQRPDGAQQAGAGRDIPVEPGERRAHEPDEAVDFAVQLGAAGLDGVAQQHAGRAGAVGARLPQAVNAGGDEAGELRPRLQHPQGQLADIRHGLEHDVAVRAMRLSFSSNSMQRRPSSRTGMAGSVTRGTRPPTRPPRSGSRDTGLAGCGRFIVSSLSVKRGHLLVRGMRGAWRVKVEYEEAQHLLCIRALAHPVQAVQQVLVEGGQQPLGQVQRPLPLQVRHGRGELVQQEAEQPLQLLPGRLLHQQRLQQLGGRLHSGGHPGLGGLVELGLLDAAVQGQRDDGAGGLAQKVGGLGVGGQRAELLEVAEGAHGGLAQVGLLVRVLEHLVPLLQLVVLPAQPAGVDGLGHQRQRLQQRSLGLATAAVLGGQAGHQQVLWCLGGHLPAGQQHRQPFLRRRAAGRGGLLQEAHDAAAAPAAPALGVAALGVGGQALQHRVHVGGGHQAGSLGDGRPVRWVRVPAGGPDGVQQLHDHLTALAVGEQHPGQRVAELLLGGVAAGGGGLLNQLLRQAGHVLHIVKVAIEELAKLRHHQVGERGQVLVQVGRQAGQGAQGVAAPGARPAGQGQQAGEQCLRLRQAVSDVVVDDGVSRAELLLEQGVHRPADGLGRIGELRRDEELQQGGEQEAGAAGHGGAHQLQHVGAQLAGLLVSAALQHKLQQQAAALQAQVAVGCHHYDCLRQSALHLRTGRERNGRLSENIGCWQYQQAPAITLGLESLMADLVADRMRELRSARASWQAPTMWRSSARAASLLRSLPSRRGTRKATVRSGARLQIRPKQRNTCGLSDGIELPGDATHGESPPAAKTRLILILQSQRRWRLRGGLRRGLLSEQGREQLLEILRRQRQRRLRLPELAVGDEHVGQGAADVEGLRVLLVQRQHAVHQTGQLLRQLLPGQQLRAVAQGVNDGHSQPGLLGRHQPVAEHEIVGGGHLGGEGLPTHVRVRSAVRVGDVLHNGLAEPADGIGEHPTHVVQLHRAQLRQQPPYLSGGELQHALLHSLGQQVTGELVFNIGEDAMQRIQNADSVRLRVLEEAAGLNRDSATASRTCSLLSPAVASSESTMAAIGDSVGLSRNVFKSAFRDDLKVYLFRPAVDPILPVTMKDSYIAVPLTDTRESSGARGCALSIAAALRAWRVLTGAPADQHSEDMHWSSAPEKYPSPGPSDAAWPLILRTLCRDIDQTALPQRRVVPGGGRGSSTEKRQNLQALDYVIGAAFIAAAEEDALSMPTASLVRHRRVRLLLLAAGAPAEAGPEQKALADWGGRHRGLGRQQREGDSEESFMLLSASVNSISSMPSPVYQCKKARRRYMAENCVPMRRNSSWIAVLLPTKEAHLGRWHNAKGVHDAVGVLLADLGDQQGAHAAAGAAAQRVGQLEALQAVAALGLLAHHIEHGVHQLGALRVVALGPVVAGAALSEHEIVRPEQLAERAGPDTVHGAGLQVHQHGPWHVLAAAGLVVVDAGPGQLNVGGVASVGPSWASLNCCVLLCNDCSSVHRSLGRHVSQVKSLTHHRWRDTQIKMVRQVVAGGSNKFWEYSILEKQRGKDSVRKPRPGDPVHPTKADFIKRKYEKQAFCKRYSAKEAATEASDASQQLHASVRTPNVEISFRLLARGADPNYLHPEKGSSALHVAAQERQPLQAELLLVFGADPELRDRAGRTALDLAEAPPQLPELTLLLVEARYELSDRFADFLCARVPDHRTADSPGGHFLLPSKSGSTADSVGGIDGGDARLRLAALPASAFQELLRDAYDELDRRDSNRVLRDRLGAEAVAGLELLFLPLNPHYSATRNQGRQKLGRLSVREFGVLLGDALEEAARRSGVAPSLCARPSADPPNSAPPAPAPALESSPSRALASGSGAASGGMSRSLDNGLSEDPVYDIVPADSEYASINPNRQRQAASCSADPDREEPEQPNPAPPPPPPPPPQSQPADEAAADPLKAALAALYGAASQAVAESAAAATSESTKSSLCRVSDLSESAVSGPQAAEPSAEVPVSQEDVLRLKASHDRLLEENRALRLQVEMLQRQNAELLAKARDASSPPPPAPPASSSPQLPPHTATSALATAPAAAPAATPSAAPAAARLSSSAVPAPNWRAQQQQQRPHTTIGPDTAAPPATRWEPPPPPPPPPLYENVGEPSLSALEVGVANGDSSNPDPSPPPPPPPLPDEADYDQPPPESDEEAECDRLPGQARGCRYRHSAGRRSDSQAAGAAAALHQRSALPASKPSSSAPPQQPVMAPRPAPGPAPTQEEVVALTEAVTGRIYKLLEAARQGNHECFPECAAAIRNSVLHMATVIPR